MSPSSILPIAFSSVVGTTKPMLGVANALNPDQHIVIDGFFSFLKIYSDFRKASIPFSRRPAERQTPVLINYGTTPWRNHMIRTLKHRFPHAFAIQIGLPRRANDDLYDLVALLPFEEPGDIDAKKIIRINAVPSSVTPQNIRQHETEWSPILKTPERKLVAVFFGGDISTDDLLKFSRTDTFAFMDRVKMAQRKHDCDIVLTTSRRTSEETKELLRQHLVPHCKYSYFFDDEDAPNPYNGYLACADAFVATGDSMSLLSELIDTGKFVHAMWPFSLPDGNERAFFRSLRQQEQIIVLSQDMPGFNQDILTFGQKQPIRSANMIALKTQEMLSTRHRPRVA